MVSARAKSESAYAMIQIFSDPGGGVHNMWALALQKPFYMRFFYTFNPAH